VKWGEPECGEPAQNERGNPSVPEEFP